MHIEMMNQLFLEHLDARRMDPYFRDHMAFWIDQPVCINMDQPEDDNDGPGVYLDRLYYWTTVFEQLGQEHKIGFPNAWTRRTLTLRTTVEHVLRFLKLITECEVPERFNEGKRAFIESLTRKLYELA